MCSTASHVSPLGCPSPPSSLPHELSLARPVPWDQPSPFLSSLAVPGIKQGTFRSRWAGVRSLGQRRRSSPNAGSSESAVLFSGCPWPV